MSLRAVFDTNTVVSALLFQGGQLGWLRGVWAGNRMTPLVSRHTVEELVRVLAYPKLDLSPDDRNEILGEYLPHAETLKEPIAPPDLPPCRDPDDRKFLILAAAARVDTLVTGDRDLLDLRGPAPVPILTPAELRRKLATCAKGKGRETLRTSRSTERFRAQGRRRLSADHQSPVTISQDYRVSPWAPLRDRPWRCR